jgi:hypothetical protein
MKIAQGTNAVAMEWDLRQTGKDMNDVSERRKEADGLRRGVVVESQSSHYAHTATRPDGLPRAETKNAVHTVVGRTAPFGTLRGN